MTQITDEQGQRLEAAARSVAPRLERFMGDLSPEELEALGLALRQIAAGAGHPPGDTAGHMLTGDQPAVPGAAVLRQVLGSALGIVSPGPRVLSSTPPTSPPVPPIPSPGPRRLA